MLITAVPLRLCRQHSTGLELSMSGKGLSYSNSFHSLPTRITNAFLEASIGHFRVPCAFVSKRVLTQKSVSPTGSSSTYEPHFLLKGFTRGLVLKQKRPTDLENSLSFWKCRLFPGFCSGISWRIFQFDEQFEKIIKIQSSPNIYSNRKPSYLYKIVRTSKPRVCIMFPEQR